MTNFYLAIKLAQKLLFPTAFLCTILSCPQLALAENKSLMGEIAFEDSAPQKNSYATTQDKTLDYFKQLASHVEHLAEGQASGQLPTLEEAGLNYLTGVYLYCAVNFGECSMLLDAILEIDLINSKLNAKAECPNMTKFWKFWVRNDMESRHKYMVKTGFLKVTSDFNQHKRPSYIKCQGKIQQQIDTKVNQSEFFKSRYSSDSPYNLVAVKAVKLLEDVKRRIPNIFVAVGAQSAP